MLYNQQIEHQKELLSTQMEIQTQTMQHIGREIHDNIGQKLTLASLYIQQLLLQKTKSETNAVENINEIINNSLVELRLLSKSLTDNKIESETLVLLLQSECEKTDKLQKCTFSYNPAANQIPILYQTKSIVLRITQEFIQNSIKHANCEKINVCLHITNTNLSLFLEDDGKGFVYKNNNKGIGLINIKKRTEIIGGKFELISSDKGTKITLEIPL